MNSLGFNRVDRDNLAQCQSVFVRVFNAPPWNESWQMESVARRLEDIFQTPGFYGLLCQIEGETTGFALGNIEQWDETKHFHLREMCVIGAQQRRGVGAALMNALEENLSSEGVQKLYLHTVRETPAQGFYEKQDFYVSPKMITMAKWLNSS